jgi:GNAT superfamily N-acetyltransferase
MTASALRGRGLGAQMLEWPFATCRARGCATIHLKSHGSRRAAHRFHARLGFVPSHVAMIRPL